MSIIINSKFVTRVRNRITKMAKKLNNNKLMVVDDKTFPGIEIVVNCPGSIYTPFAHARLNGFSLGLRVDEINNKNNEHAVGIVIAKAIHDKCETIEKLSDLLKGLSLYQPLETKLGLTIHYNNDIHHHALMIQETAGDKRTVFAFEEGVNAEISMTPELLTDPTALKMKVMKVMGDYIMADLVTDPIDLVN
jgi:hypothetical protein